MLCDNVKKKRRGGDASMPCSTTEHRIGWAVKQATSGRKVTRRGWKTPGQYVSYVQATRQQKAYLAWHTRSGRSWPATLGQRDLLAKDWQLVS